MVHGCTQSPDDWLVPTAEESIERRPDPDDVLLGFKDAGGALQEELVEVKRLAQMRPAHPVEPFDRFRVAGTSGDGNGCHRSASAAAGASANEAAPAQPAVA